MSDPRFMTSTPEGKPEWWSSDHWATPWPIVRQLEMEFGVFDLDPCCVPDTAKVPRYYTEDDDGLALPWFGRVFLNPPYSKPAPWLEKAIAETRSRSTALVIALLPVATDTSWFHDLVQGHAEIRFIKRRVRFFGWQNTPITSPKSPSMFAIYRRSAPTVEPRS